MTARCPECGQHVKPENLATHLGRVHPRSRDKYPDLRPQRARRRATGAPRWIPYAALLVVATLAAGVYFATSGGPAPRFYADHKSYDFGHVGQATYSHEFPFENRGESDLRILAVSSSCDCTSAHVVLGGVQSPHFGMHGNPAWEGVVFPGMSGTVVVLYDAVQMPDLYAGPRAVFVRTNDPANLEVTFIIQVHEPPP